MEFRQLLRRGLRRLRPQPIEPIEPPVRFRDAQDRDVLVRAFESDDFDGLVGMYDGFDPTQRAQGTPPIGREAIESWLETLLGGINLVAIVSNTIVGHVCFVPDDTGRHELAIFVHQDFQGAGIGTTLLGAGLAQAKAKGVTYVWLSVEAWKRDAQRLYGRAGFTTVNAMGPAHRMTRYL